MSNTHDNQPEGPSGDLFGEIISSYTDAEALEDRFLGELHSGVIFLGLPINRTTSNLFNDLRPFVEAEAALFNGDFDRALASILRTKCSFASGDPGNIGEIGDIYRIPPKLWLVRNEVGGWTAMYPEDYLGAQKQQESGTKSRSLAFCSDGTTVTLPSSSAALPLPSAPAVRQQSYCVQLGSSCALSSVPPSALSLPIAPSVRVKFSCALPPTASVSTSSS